MNTLSVRTWVRNAAAVFAGTYGSVAGQARRARCSRQALYDQARRIERRLQSPTPAAPPAEVAAPTAAASVSLDGSTRRRLAVTAFAIGVSTRQIEDLLRVLVGDDGPDHSTIARWIKDAAEKAEPILRAFDAACVPEVRTMAIDEIFFGGDRLWSGSSRRA